MPSPTTSSPSSAPPSSSGPLLHHSELNKLLSDLSLHDLIDENDLREMLLRQKMGSRQYLGMEELCQLLGQKGMSMASGVGFVEHAIRGEENPQNATTHAETGVSQQRRHISLTTNQNDTSVSSPTNSLLPSPDTTTTSETILSQIWSHFMSQSSQQLAKYKQLQQEHQQLLQEYNTLKGSHTSELDLQKESFQSLIQQHIDSFQSINSKHEKIMTEHKNLHKELELKQSEQHGTQQVIVSMENTIATLRHDKDALEGILHDREAELKDASQSLNKCIDENEQLLRYVHLLEKEREEQLEKGFAFQQRNEDLQQQLLETQEVVASQKGIIDGLRSTVQSQHKQLVHTQDQNAGQKHTIQQLNEQIVDLEEAYSHSVSERYQFANMLWNDADFEFFHLLTPHESENDHLRKYILQLKMQLKKRDELLTQQKMDHEDTSLQPLVQSSPSLTRTQSRDFTKSNSNSSSTHTLYVREPKGISPKGDSSARTSVFYVSQTDARQHFDPSNTQQMNPAAPWLQQTTPNDSTQTHKENLPLFHKQAHIPTDSSRPKQTRTRSDLSLRQKQAQKLQQLHRTYGKDLDAWFKKTHPDSSNKDNSRRKKRPSSARHRTPRKRLTSATRRATHSARNTPTSSRNKGFKSIESPSLSSSRGAPRIRYSEPQANHRVDRSSLNSSASNKSPKKQTIKTPQRPQSASHVNLTLGTSRKSSIGFTALRTHLHQYFDEDALSTVISQNQPLSSLILELKQKQEKRLELLKGVKDSDKYHELKMRFDSMTEAERMELRKQMEIHEETLAQKQKEMEGSGKGNTSPSKGLFVKPTPPAPSSTRGTSSTKSGFRRFT